MLLLENKTAVITGGARGIGHAIATAFVDQGCRVVLADRHAEAAALAAEQLVTKAQSPIAIGVGCDVVHAADIETAIQAGVDAFTSFDVLINNAGITRDATMRTMTEDQFDQVIAIHLKGCWNGTRIAAARMREQGSGAIVNISSLSGKVGMIGQTNYSAAKAGIIGLTKAAAKETARHGVRVNAIQPGLIRSAMTEQMPERVWTQKLAEIPMERVGEPSEVAGVAVFLASELSSYVTGAVVEVTGGRLM